MESIQNSFENLKNWSRKPRTKKRMYLLFVLIAIAWVGYRFAVIGAQNRLYVFNPARMAAQSGMVVDVQIAKKQTGVLHEPLTIKNNRALVSGARAHTLRPGQKVGDGVIVSVSANVDLDTGMHVVRTRGAKDGLNYAQYQTSGYFVPSYAVVNDTVYVAADDVAHARPVRVSGSDADTSVITDGLSEGDIIILSRTHDGAKIQIKK